MLGAFRTSPRLSLCAEAAEPPLSFRRSILTANFLVSLSKFPQHPLHHSIVSFIHPSFIDHPKRHIRTNLEIILTHKLRLNSLTPITTTTPPWALPRPNIRLDLTEVSKMNKSIIKQHIMKLLNEFPDHTLCLTDGSKYNQKTAYAYSINEQITARRIRNSASVYSAELLAILTCLSQIAQLEPQKNYLLLTDSLSSLQSLTNPFSTNPVIQRIHLTLLTIKTINSNLTFIWIPGHINYSPHDAVDEAAKEATTYPNITDHILTPPEDLKNYYSTEISQLWHENWRDQNLNKLRKIKTEPISWSSSHRDSRREEVILARLRIGHTRLTHTYLLTNLAPPSCPHCSADNLSVEHFFSCPALQNTRSNLKIPSTITSTLNNNSETINTTLTYLRTTQFYDLI